MKTRKPISIVIIFEFFALGFFCAPSAAVYIRKAPPAKRVVVRPARPHKSAVWATGHWTAKKGTYVWISGTWQKNRPGYAWIDGHWQNTARGWIWVKGHWSKK